MDDRAISCPNTPNGKHVYTLDSPERCELCRFEKPPPQFVQAEKPALIFARANKSPKLVNRTGSIFKPNSICVAFDTKLRRLKIQLDSITIGMEMRAAKKLSLELGPWLKACEVAIENETEIPPPKRVENAVTWRFDPGSRQVFIEFLAGGTGMGFSGEVRNQMRFSCAVESVVRQVELKFGEIEGV